MKKEYCCPICGNINVESVNKKQVYCPNCYEYTDYDKLKEVPAEYCPKCEKVIVEPHYVKVYRSGLTIEKCCSRACKEKIKSENTQDLYSMYLEVKNQ